MLWGCKIGFAQRTGASARVGRQSCQRAQVIHTRGCHPLTLFFHLRWEHSLT